MTKVHQPADEQPVVRGREIPRDGEQYVYMRVEDRSIWFRLAYYQDKYKILMIPLTALLLLGARQWIRDTMRETTANLQAQIDTTRQTVAKEIASRDSVNQKLTILLRVTCISSRATKTELSLAGLNCASFSSVAP